MEHYRQKAGFSLVELSIVLVILGLLTGGILGGQALIKAAEMRAVTTELSNWQTAVNTFRQKYFALPGDFRDATRFWGAHGTCLPPAGAVMTATCNGDGDGVIALHESPTEAFEAFLFWQHLSLAGLIEGNYSGARGTSNIWHHVPGVNSPRSKFGSAAWAVESSTTEASDGHGAEKFDKMYNNAFLFGNASSYEMNYEPVLTPEEAWNIDTKVDDGKPGQGAVIALNHPDCTDAADRSDLDSDYALSTDTAECSMYFEGSM